MPVQSPSSPLPVPYPNTLIHWLGFLPFEKQPYPPNRNQKSQLADHLHREKEIFETLANKPYLFREKRKSFNGIEVWVSRRDTGTASETDLGCNRFSSVQECA